MEARQRLVDGQGAQQWQSGALGMLQTVNGELITASSSLHSITDVVSCSCSPCPLPNSAPEAPCVRGTR